MTRRLLRGDHVRLIATSYLWTSLRSGAGVIFLVLSMIVGLVLAGIAVWPVETLEAMSKSGKSADVHFSEIVQEFGPKVLHAFTDASPDQASYLLNDRPALVSLFFILLLAFIPFLASLSGFNQTSGDIGSKGLRYMLFRTERANIFIGRLIATYLFTVAVITLIIAVVGLYTVVKVKFYPAADVVAWLARGWLGCAVFLLPWVALSAWISTTMEIPFLSLLITELGLLLWVVIVHVMATNFDQASYGAYATPWGYKWWLLDASAAKMSAGVAVMLGFTAVFTWLGLRHLDRRDL
jgi:hypothetical protein